MTSRSPFFVALVAIFAAVGACTSFRDASIATPDASLTDASTDTTVDASVDAGGQSPFAVTQVFPEGEALMAIWGADADDIFAVGTNGLHYEYYQGTWNRDQTVLGRDLYGVWGSSATDVYAVGVVDANGFGIVQHWDGTSWTDEYIAPTPLYGVWGTASVVLAVGAQGMLYGKDVGTTDWAMRLGDAGLPANPNVVGAQGEPILWAIAGNSIDDFAMPADVDRIFHLEADGDFVNLDPTVDRTITFRSVFAASANPATYFFGTNYFGVAWLTSDGPPDAAILDDDLFVISEDQGTPGAEQLFIYGIWGQNDQFVFTGDLGRIYAFSTAENSFTPVPSPTNASLYGAWGSSISDVWIVGDNEVILHGALSAP
jgi:hypothetical protein